MITSPRFLSIRPDDERLQQARQVTIKKTYDDEHDRAVFTVSDAPTVVLISAEVIEDLEDYGRLAKDQAPISLSDDVVRWAFDNCWCRYRVVGYSHRHDALVCERVESVGG
jgi:hypothetical protein